MSEQRGETNERYYVGVASVEGANTNQAWLSPPLLQMPWATRACVCCHQWFDYIMRDRERQPIVCKTCAGDQL